MEEMFELTLKNTNEFDNIYVLRKVRIGTIPESSCAKWEFSLCRAK